MHRRTHWGSDAFLYPLLYLISSAHSNGLCVLWGVVCVRVFRCINTFHDWTHHMSESPISLQLMKGCFGWSPKTRQGSGSPGLTVGSSSPQASGALTAEARRAPRHTGAAQRPPLALSDAECHPAFLSFSAFPPAAGTLCLWTPEGAPVLKGPRSATVPRHRGPGRKTSAVREEPSGRPRRPRSLCSTRAAPGTRRLL